MDKQKLTTVLMIAGLCVVTVSALLPRFVTISDTLKGFLMGMGIGMVALSAFINVMLKKRK